MDKHPVDVVFLVRLRRLESSREMVLRGSVYDVGTARRLYVSNVRDIADFIEARLAELKLE